MGDRFAGDPLSADLPRRRPDRRDYDASAVGYLIVVLIVVLVVGGWALKAGAHDWYPRECCSDKDCGAINDPREVSEDGAFFVYRGVRFRKDATKPSPDERYHACYVRPPGMGGQPFIRCFWKPEPGS